MRRQRTAEDERVERRRHERRTCHAARAEAHAACGPAPFPPRSASVRKLRADGARTRIDLRRPPTGPNARRARRLGPAVAREPTGSPRIPTTDVIIDTFVSSVETPSGARLSPPAP